MKFTIEFNGTTISTEDPNLVDYVVKNYGEGKETSPKKEEEKTEDKKEKRWEDLKEVTPEQRPTSARKTRKKQKSKRSHQFWTLEEDLRIVESLHMPTEDIMRDSLLRKHSMGAVKTRVSLIRYNRLPHLSSEHRAAIEAALAEKQGLFPPKTRTKFGDSEKWTDEENQTIVDYWGATAAEMAEFIPTRSRRAIEARMRGIKRKRNARLSKEFVELLYEKGIWQRPEETTNNEAMPLSNLLPNI